MSSLAYKTNIGESTASRALVLLGQGVPPNIVAASLGISESRISQLVSDPDFAAQVAELRYNALQAHSTRDGLYDEMEDALLKRLKDLLPLMMKPWEVIRSIQVINAAKRRGASAPEQIVQQQTVINLTLPTQIIQRFQTNPQNHVIHAGEQTLVTLQSAALLNKTKGNTDHDSTRAIDSSNVPALLQRAG